MRPETDELEKLLSVEEEDLSDGCMALPEDTQKSLAAAERQQRIMTYFGLKNNAEALKATINWTEKHLGSAGKEKCKSYLENLEKIEDEMRHQIRAVKLLDKKFPNP